MHDVSPHQSVVEMTGSPEGPSLNLFRSSPYKHCMTTHPVCAFHMDASHACLPHFPIFPPA